METLWVEYLSAFSKMCKGLTLMERRKLAYETAVENNNIIFQKLGKCINWLVSNGIYDLERGIRS